MRVHLDELDVRILRELQDDARLPFTRVASELGVAEGTVRHRVSRLTRRRLVKFVADVDPVELGLVMAYVLIRVRGASLMSAARALEAIDEVDYVAICAGSYDLLLEVICRDSEHLLEVLNGSIRQVQGVNEVDTLTTLRVSKDSYRWAGLEEVSSDARRKRTAMEGRSSRASRTTPEP
jgi:Lrp/AsnC family transcriptional regulator for asnA, asnC and gidA